LIEPNNSLFVSKNSLFRRHNFPVPKSVNSSLNASKARLSALLQQYIQP